MLNFKSIVTIFLLITCIGLSLSANPFLGAPQGPTPVRPPSRSIPKKIVDAQLQFKEKMGHLFSKLTDNEETSQGIPVLISLLGIGFLYGVLHALGPGHRKTVIFSLFLARKTFPMEPLMAGFLSSFLHGFSAVGIIFIYRTLTARIFLEKVDSASIYLEGITYLLLALLALILLILEIANHGKNKEKEGNEPGLYSTIAAASLFPCPIAIMILVFSLTIDYFFIGILIVIALSLGMGVVISAAGFFARLSRVALFSKFITNQERIKTVGKVLEMGSYLFLILFSLWMALPFMENFF
jgi:nickel/cobalt exporter